MFKYLKHIVIIVALLSLFCCKTRETDKGNRHESLTMINSQQSYPKSAERNINIAKSDTGTHAVYLSLSIRDSLIRRLSPTIFYQLPESISTYLYNEGYTIPQTYRPEEHQNYITGSFRDRDQRDWAVLASRNHVSTILVFWNGSPSDISEIAAYPDSLSIRKIMSESIPEDSMGYIRKIAQASEYIVALRAERSKTISSLLITHDGIENSHRFESSVYYNHNGKWIIIPANN